MFLKLPDLLQHPPPFGGGGLIAAASSGLFRAPTLRCLKQHLKKLSNTLLVYS